MNFEGDVIFDSSKPDGNPRKLLDSEKINTFFEVMNCIKNNAEIFEHFTPALKTI